MNDAALALFQQIADEKTLLRFIKGQVEGLYLDYKCKKDHNTKDVDEDCQKLLSKAISGFANADGGIVVIGVDAPQNQARTLKPIVPIADFEEQVASYIPRSTAFGVPGVQCKRIELAGGGGVIIVYVPRSELSPHCSQKDKRYYQRHGDSFMTMEHFQVADMFGRRQQPYLVPSVRLYNDVNYSGHFEVLLQIDNIGRAVARFPFIELDQPCPVTPNQFGMGNGSPGLPQVLSRAGNVRFVGGGDHVIHPGTTLEINRFKGKFGTVSPLMLPVVLSGKIAADNFVLRKWQVVLNGISLMSVHAGGKVQREEYIACELIP